MRELLAEVCREPRAEGCNDALRGVLTKLEQDSLEMHGFEQHSLEQHSLEQHSLEQHSLEQHSLEVQRA